MTRPYNLVDEAWIPCQVLNGDRVFVGFRDLLVHAHELRRIAGNSPLDNIALLPPVLAILYRALGPIQSSRQWSRIWKTRQFSADAIDAYLEQWYERFDLFHPEHPFYQAADERVKRKSIIYLLESIANTGTLFTHTDEADQIVLSPAEAARLLITAQQFRLGGGNSGAKAMVNGKEKSLYYSDSIYARGVLFWAHGDTLFETLALNLMPYPRELTSDRVRHDAPAWEVDDPFVPQREIPHGYLDYLTWQTNRIMLFPAEDSAGVSECTICPVMPLSADVISPQKRYLIAKKEDGTRESRFLYFNTERVLWRDYHTLLSLDTDAQRPPQVIEWLANLVADGYLDRQRDWEVTAVGILANQAKPIFYREEQVPLPRFVLQQQIDMRLVAEAVELAEAIHYKTINSALRTLAANVLMRGSTRKPDSTDVTKLVDHWNVRRLYWERLEPAFWAFVAELASDPEAARRHWRDTLKHAARAVLAAACDLVGASPASLKGEVIATRQLNGKLKKLLH